MTRNTQQGDDINNMNKKHLHEMSDNDRFVMLKRLNEVMITEFGIHESDISEMWRTLSFGTQVKQAIVHTSDPDGETLLHCIRSGLLGCCIE